VTFINPVYLLGAALVAVPIIIHLWFRRKLKRVPFSSLAFLRTTEARRLGWLKLRDILVLALRCFFVLFLFLSLAKPQLTAPWSARQPEVPVHRLASVILMIDDTYSMGYGDNFRRAQDAARELLRRYSPAGEFCAVPLTGRPGPRSWTGLNGALKQVEECTLSCRTGSIKQALENIGTGAPAYELDYWYIGDGQEIVFKDLNAEALSGRRLMWFKIPGGGNAGIARVSMVDPVSIVTDKYQILATVQNHSGRILKGSARLVSREQEFTTDLLVQPNQSTDVVFTLPVQCNTGTVAILDGDSLVIDNEYYFAKNVPIRIKVLIVGASEYLKNALSPVRAATMPFDVRTVMNLKDGDLRTQAVLILNNVPDLSKGDEIRVRDFLARRNTGALIFLGSEPGPGMRHFIGDLAAVHGSVAPKGYLTLDWVDADNQVFKVFKNAASLKGIRFYRLNDLEARGRGSVLARVDRYPLIIQKDNVCIVATECVPGNTDLVYRAIFVPLLHRLASSVVYRLPDREYAVGAAVDTAKVLQDINGGYKLTSITRPGLYCYGGDTVGVNVDPPEGDLRSIDEGSAAQLGVQVVRSLNALAGVDLTTVCLMIALCALVIEAILLLLR
jgi:hypothetical protein